MPQFGRGRARARGRRKGEGGVKGTRPSRRRRTRLSTRVRSERKRRLTHKAMENIRQREASRKTKAKVEKAPKKTKPKGGKKSARGRSRQKGADGGRKISSVTARILADRERAAAPAPAPARARRREGPVVADRERRAQFGADRCGSCNGAAAQRWRRPRAYGGPRNSRRGTHGQHAAAVINASSTRPRRRYRTRSALLPQMLSDANWP